jgi:hypothetical protein
MKNLATLPQGSASGLRHKIEDGGLSSKGGLGDEGEEEEEEKSPLERRLERRVAVEFGRSESAPKSGRLRDKKSRQKFRRSRTQSHGSRGQTDHPETVERFQIVLKLFFSRKILTATEL